MPKYKFKRTVREHTHQSFTLYENRVDNNENTFRALNGLCNEMTTRVFCA